MGLSWGGYYPSPEPEKRLYGRPLGHGEAGKKTALVEPAPDWTGATSTAIPQMSARGISRLKAKKGRAGFDPIRKRMLRCSELR
jgi:hypothetical protein